MSGCQTLSCGSSAKLAASRVPMCGHTSLLPEWVRESPTEAVLVLHLYTLPFCKKVTKRSRPKAASAFKESSGYQYLVTRRVGIVSALWSNVITRRVITRRVVSTSGSGTEGSSTDRSGTDAYRNSGTVVAATINATAINSTTINANTSSIVCVRVR